MSTQMHSSGMIEPGQAFVLGVVEGLTEFLPVSSTGHLILTSEFLALQGEAVNTFAVVIQAGALLAVLGLYRSHVASMWRGLLGRDASGRRLLEHVLISFLPAAFVGLLTHRFIKSALFGTGPVVTALAFGGIIMIGVEWWRGRSGSLSIKTMDAMSTTDAIVIGFAQCAALWPGMSRSMVTIVAGLILGFSARAAAEYSFLLALPTLGAATFFDAVFGGFTLMQEVGLVSMGCGLLTAAVVAACAIRGLIYWLTRRGLTPFAWYRLGLAAVVWFGVPRI